jgi:hypothetical protein
VNSSEERPPYDGPWGVNAEGTMTGPGGIGPTDAERDAFISGVEAKIAAGTASMTERRCLSAVRMRLERESDDTAS